VKVDIKETFGEFDLIIVGSGPAGLSAAKRALQLDKRVLNLDWGPHEFPNYSAHLFSSQIRSTGGLGGTAHHWGGQFGTLSEFDKANWKFLSKCDSDFFIHLEESQISLCHAMGIDYSCFLSYSSERNLKPSLNQSDRITLIPAETRILNLFKTTIDDSNYTFIPGKKLQSIQTNKDNSRTLIFEKESIDIGNIPIVVATGCIEATRIMYESYKISGQRLPNSIGKFLSDHPSLYGSTYEITRKPKMLPPEIFTNGTKKKYEISVFHSNLGIYQSGIFEIRKEIQSIFTNPLNNDFYSLKNFKSILSAIVFCRQLSRSFRTRYRLWYQIEQLRSPNSSLVFGKDSMDAKCSLSDKDLELFTLLQEYGEAEMMRYSLSKSISAPEIQSNNLEQAFHPSGTLSFGCDPEESVTNHYGKVHRMPHTWVASSALFPTCGWFNPSLIIMAFGYLAVEDIFKNEKQAL